MKKLLSISALAVAAAFANVGAASAADMPVKAAPLPPPVYDWTGIYVGFHEGWEWGHVSDSYVGFPALTGTSTTSQPIAGFHVGVQKQFAGFGWGNWVIGAEGGLNEPLKQNSVSNFSSPPCGNPAAFTCGLQSISDNWYAGGRLGLAWNWGGGGWLFGGDYLLTVSGGWTSAIFHREDPLIANNNIINNGGQYLVRHDGGYVGAGLEHVWAKGVLVDWISGIDYMHEFYGNTNNNIDALGFAHNLKVDLDIVRVRTTLKFH